MIHSRQNCIKYFCGCGFSSCSRDTVGRHCRKTSPTRIFEVEEDNYPEWTAIMKLVDTPAFGIYISSLNITPSLTSTSMPANRSEQITRTTSDLRIKIPRKNLSTCKKIDTIELAKTVNTIQKPMDTLDQYIKKSKDFTAKMETAAKKHELQLIRMQAIISKEL